ncbi:uncharacterized protein PRCAT00004246001 [Priceomyces carsonii]|uniref:uncharacterized protein n=1 Tax=Priceomyces carsonii TaxID=28549 RepID=UPI002ED8DFDB|nr:unnamed protein product [Priceomyces carsonii]
MLYTKELIDGLRAYDLPQVVIDNEVRTLIEKIESIEGFNPTQKFDPERHILFKEGDFQKTKILKLPELGITKTHVDPITDVAVTEPFPLFTEEACNIMKWEAFLRSTIQKYGRVPIMAKKITSTDFQVCGYSEHAPFTVAAWKHPRVQEIINKFAGVGLKIMFDYEIAQINASLVDNKKPIGKVKAANHSQDPEELGAVFDWHYDSNSITVVLMLSTNDNIDGGKTGLKNGSEEVVFIGDPKVGYATLLQGRVVKHVACKPFSNDERISSVVGYIPESLDVPDTTVLTTFRPSVAPRSIHNEYYPQWIDYRFKRVEDRLKRKRQQLMSRMRNGESFEQIDVVEFCKDISDYLMKSWNEFECIQDSNNYPPALFSIPYKDL